MGTLLCHSFSVTTDNLKEYVHYKEEFRGDNKQKIKRERVIFMESNGVGRNLLLFNIFLLTQSRVFIGGQGY